ncbi:phospholipase D family protein [Luteolibacter marinus]|uniref:phospholipase D family protein n=1 Tax=Luteolibacter marinus TaxID=2776705 RepID=UPI001866D265|nr:phospholipase D family protein [Luteolibacter marinus]
MSAVDHAGSPTAESRTAGRMAAACLFDEAAARHPGKSGFALIRFGRAALTARVALTELAERTLDVQYYIWGADATGRILAERLIRAADRGVKVRVLLDDINLSGRDDMVACLDAHPNVEIRIFNPFRNRRVRALDFLTNPERINHRMHNKIMVMDGAVAIVGGRNVGDHYFEVDPDSNFRDLDLAAVGPVVRETTAVFDRFWGGDWAVPIREITGRERSPADLVQGLAVMRGKIAADHYPHPLERDTDAMVASLEAIRDDLVWAPGRVVWDDPSSIREKTGTGRMTEALYQRLDRLESELLIESAYFVPRERAVETLRELHEKGRRVRILTNSLASNDVLAAHAGYSKHRAEVIGTGAELYEFRPDPDDIRQRLVSAKSLAGLHTKAIVFDRRDVFIGSFNLDPRSGSINTEAGLYVESEELAEQVTAFLDAGTKPTNSYRVIRGEDGALVWTTEDHDGHEVRYQKDPNSTWWQRWVVGAIRCLPVERQL